MKFDALLALILFSGSATAGNVAGAWSNPKSEWFFLELIERGSMVCGRVEAISGQRVDFSWIVGMRTGSDLPVQFTSSFADNGSRGIARLRRIGTQLEWLVTQQPTGENWIPDEVRVRQKRWAKGRQKLISAWCESKWQVIQQGNLDGIQLVEP